MDDEALLREYVERRSERAFAELVARHLPVVHGVATRIVGERQAGQDVAQAVFVQLARKGWTVRRGQALGGWLYRAAYRLALNACREEQRRRRREGEAVILAEQDADAPVAWEKVAPLLEAAMAELPRVEQDAVVLRFFQGKSFGETGAALELSEEAARKRVNRALEKMRGYFARRGVAASAGLLGEALRANAAPAVGAGAAAAVTEAAWAGGAGTAGVLAKLLFMTTQTKVLLVAAGVLVLAAIPAAKYFWQETPEAVAVEKKAPVVAASKAAVTAPSVAAGVPVGQKSTGPAVVHEGVLIVPALPEPTAAKPAIKPWALGGYMAAADLTDAGLGTPEDALQTYLWAKKNGLKSQVDAMVVNAAPVVYDLTKGGTVEATEEDMARLYNAAIKVKNALGVESLPTGATDDATVVKPGTSPFDPTLMKQQMEAAMQNASTTPLSTPPDPDATKLNGATLVKRQDISPSEVMFVVSGDYASTDAGGEATAPTTSAYDFTLSDGSWKYAIHTITMSFGSKPNEATLKVIQAINEAEAGTSASSGNMGQGEK